MTEDLRPPDVDEVLSIDDLIRLAEVGEWEDSEQARNAALDTAIEWWDESASIAFIGALDND